MDARRNRRAQDPEATRLSKSNSTLPGLIILAAGVLCLIASICLFAAFGFPTDISEEPEQISGIVALAVGAVLTLIGIMVAVYLKRQKEKQLKELARSKKARVSPNVSPSPYNRGPPPNYQDIPRQQRQYKHYDSDFMSTVSS